MLNNLDGQFLLNSVKGNVELDISSVPMEEQYVSSMICENPHYRVDLSLQPLYNPLHELRLGITFISGRIDAVNFNREEPIGANGWRSEYLSIDAHSDEIALEGSYLFSTPKFKGFSLYGGAGTNLGITYNGDVVVNYRKYEHGGNIGDEIPDTQFQSSAFEYYEQKEGVAQRVFVTGGLRAEIRRRVEIGIEWKYGYGYRYISGQAVSPLNLQSTSLSFRYILK
jgi:hypothetical protein